MLYEHKYGTPYQGHGDTNSAKIFTCPSALEIVTRQDMRQTDIIEFNKIWKMTIILYLNSNM